MDERQVVEDAVRAWMAGETDAFWRLLAPEVQYSVIGTTPVSGTFDGRRAFVDGALRPMAALLSESAVPVDYEIIAEGSRVVLLWSGRGTMLSGAPYDNSYCWVLDLRDGLVRRVRAYLDTALVSALFDQQPVGEGA